MNETGIACAPVTDIMELVKHPQALAREMFLEVRDMDGNISGITGVVPKLSDTPGSVDWGVMPRGACNQEIYTGLLGYTLEHIAQLESEGVI